jgi:hypothetical protein
MVHIDRERQYQPPTPGLILILSLTLTLTPKIARRPLWCSCDCDTTVLFLLLLPRDSGTPTCELDSHEGPWYRRDVKISWDWQSPPTGPSRIAAGRDGETVVVSHRQAFLTKRNTPILQGVGTPITLTDQDIDGGKWTLRGRRVAHTAEFKVPGPCRCTTASDSRIHSQE